MKLKLLFIMALSFSLTAQSRISEPGSRDPGDLVKVKEDNSAALEKERLAQFEKRTKDAERILIRSAIELLAKEAVLIKSYARQDAVNDLSLQSRLNEYKSNLAAPVERYKLQMSEGDFDKAKVGTLRESLSEKLSGSILSLYKSEVGKNEFKLISSFK